MKVSYFLRLGAPIAACATYYIYDSAVSPATVHAEAKHLQLQQVQVLFRHGARAPVYTLTRFSNVEPTVWDKHTLGKQFPTGLTYDVKLLGDGTPPTGNMYDDEVPTEIEGGCRTGQLTYLGQEELYALGKRFGERYIHHKGLVSASYPAPGLHFRSTYYERTVQSMMCFLAGMYSEGTVEGPIQLVTETQEREDLCGNLFGCPKFIEWYEYMFSPAARTDDENAAENEINDLLGKASDEANATFLQIYDLVKCNRHHGFDVPPVIDQNEHTIKKYALASIQKLVGNDTSVIRLSIGSFLDTVCQRIEKEVEGSGKDKLVLYSAHDWTIVSVLMSLGMVLETWPPFASHLVVELYKDLDVDRHFVRVLFNDDVVAVGEGEGEFVPVEKFLEALGAYRVSDFAGECGAC